LQNVHTKFTENQLSGLQVEKEHWYVQCTHACMCTHTHTHTHTHTQCAGNPSLPHTYTHIYKGQLISKAYFSFLNRGQPHKVTNRSLKYVENLMYVCVCG